MTTAHFRLGHANVEQPDPATDTAATIAQVVGACDVATFNEAAEHATHETLHQLDGWHAYCPTRGAAREDCVAWRSDVFKRHAAGHRVVMAGGWHHGRRRGPSRAVTWVVLEHRATRVRVIVATHHAIAKADTTARWRRPLRAQGFAGVARELRRVLRHHPHAGLILTGDLNTVGSVRFPRLDVREVHTPATYGRRRYDRLLVTPGVGVSGVETVVTRADHLALVATVEAARL